ncbi:MAG: hypothetical protein QHH76_09760 [Bacillota bacterium]|nr:hypothetical protein [Bacillota bacterium]
MQGGLGRIWFRKICRWLDRELKAFNDWLSQISEVVVAACVYRADIVRRIAVHHGPMGKGG